MRSAGKNGNLPAEPGARGESPLLQGDSEEPGRHLLARGDDRIIFALIVMARRVLAPGDKLIGLARHGRDDDGDRMAGLAFALDVTRDIADAVHVGDRSATKFHDEAGHRCPDRLSR